MATGNSTVQIDIKVVDANSGQVIAQTTQNIQKLGSAGAQAGQQAASGLAAAGKAGTQAGQSIAAGMQQANTHTLNSMDSVRLLRDDLGIRIPRAMEKVIANSSLMSGAIGTFSTALVGLGAAQLVTQMGEQVYHVYENWLDVGRAAKDYAKTLDEIRDKDFTSTRTLEATQARIASAQSSAAANRQGAAMFGGWKNAIGTIANGGSLGDAAAQMYAGAQMSKEQYKAQGQADQLQGQTSLEQKKQLDDAKTAAQHAGDGALQAGAKVDADLQQKLALLERAKQFNRDSQRANGNSAGSGDALIDQQELAARRAAAAEKTNISRKEQDEILRAQRESEAAGLQGEKKYQQELENTIKATNRRIVSDGLSTGTAERLNAEATAKYKKDLNQRLQAEQAEDRRRFAESSGSANTGLARQDDQRAAALATINEKQKNSGYVDPAQAGRDRGYTNQQFDIQGQKSIDDYMDRLKRMDDGRADSSMSANARIDAETKRTVDDLQKTWDELYKQLADSDVRRVQGQVAMNAEIAKINAEAAKQKQRNDRDLDDETRRLQGEAGRGGGGNHFVEEHRAIELELQDHLRKLQEMREQAGAADVHAQQQYAEQELAYRQIANNKELDLARQQRDKLAGTLKGFMDNPLEALKHQGEDVASKYAASMIQKRFPGAGTGDDGIFGGIFGGAHPTFGGKPRLPGGQPIGTGIERGGEGAHNGVATAQAIISATTAIIHAGGVSVAGSGSAGGNYVSTGLGRAFNVGGGTSSADASGGGSSSSGFDAGSLLGGGGSGLSIPSFGGSSGSAEAGSPSDVLQSAISRGASGLDTQSSDLSGIGVNDADGDPTSLGGGAGALGGAGSVISGGLGVYSAFEGKGGIMGGLQGALSGAQVGAQFGGPIGAAIGAGVGGVLGFIGHGARLQAQKYWFKELQPKLQAEMLAFEGGTADYQTVYDDLNSSELDARTRTKQMGSGAVDYYNERIKPAIAADMARLTREQKAGRSQVGMTAAQFHSGGMIGDFGSMATSANEGWIHAKQGEVVLNQTAAMSHMDLAQMMNAGASRDQIGDYLGGSSERAAAESGGDMHFHLHTLDTKTSQQWLQDNKHNIRGALNASYAEDSGGFA